MPQTPRSFSPKVGRILHGGDYNPDQWQDYPKILREDLRLMRLAKVNVVSLNIFGWAACEPEEGKFNFGWLDRAIDAIHKDGGQVILATPTGAKPAWMSAKYPEVRRVGRDGVRQPHGGRHNHCYSSPVYREKTRIINTKLAERYGRHPALVLWHVNNEYNSGDCHCEHCYAGFRAWLKRRHRTLKALNHACWNNFWSHTYTSWEQVEPKDPENLGLELEWRKFISDLCLDYFKAEVAPLKRLAPGIPVTTNFMGAYFGGLDYDKLADAEDVVSWDSYPAWGSGDDAWEAAVTALSHDSMRAMKGGKPWLLMESTPEGTNWREVGKGKRPGLHLASSLQAVAHGADMVGYFQWRKGRGSFEQFHGAVVDHEGSEHTRVFKEVAATGALLEKLAPVVGSTVEAQVALLWDWPSRWALEFSRGPRNTNRDYERDAQEHYWELWRRGIPVDVLSPRRDLSKYRLVIAPQLYSLDKATASKLEAYVREGGSLVMTYQSAVVDATGLCHLGGRPGLLRKVFGIWAEETDVLNEGEAQGLAAAKGNALWLKGRHAARHYAEVLHLEGARALAHYTGSWYAGTPAATLNTYGKGRAYYLASRNAQGFLDGFYGGLAKAAGLRALLKKAPEGVEVSERVKGKDRFLFLINFRPQPRTVALDQGGAAHLDSGRAAGRSVKLGPYGVAVLRMKP